MVQEKEKEMEKRRSLGTHRSVETSEDEDEEEDEATTNKTDLKWTHDDDEREDGVEGRDEEGLPDENEAWLRRSALINGLSCIINIYTYFIPISTSFLKI